jgi:glycosyltransferase involved in cell wall biosynthesis
MQRGVRVSLALPLYNGSRYMEEAIRSVLAQEMREFELLVCDDGSSDDSLAIAHRFAGEDSRVRVFTNERNLGLFPTLNRLVREASAPWVRLMGQDDVLLPNCLARESNFADSHPEVALFWCAMDYIDENSRVIGLAQPDVTPATMPPEVSLQYCFLHGCLTGNICATTLNAALVRREGLFDEAMNVAGDFELLVRLCARYPVGFLNEALVRTRRHGQQLSQLPGSLIKFAREEKAIRSRLAMELAPHLLRRHAQYERFQRGVQWFHAWVRFVAAGRFAEARELSGLISAQWSMPRLAWLWAMSANRRFFRPRPRETS